MMEKAKAHLICGKICSGKTYYAKKLAEEIGAIRLSCDDRMLQINPTGLFGDQHEVIGNRIEAELKQESLLLLAANTPVILDWGFWTPEKRVEISEYYTARGIEIVWHYIGANDEHWKQNIARRNAAVQAGEEMGFLVDDGLLAKLNRLFQEPKRDEMDVWFEY